MVGREGEGEGERGREEVTRRSGEDFEGKASDVWMRRAVGAAEEGGGRVEMIAASAMTVTMKFVMGRVREGWWLLEFDVP